MPIKLRPGRLAPRPPAPVPQPPPAPAHSDSLLRWMCWLMLLMGLLLAGAARAQAQTQPGNALAFDGSNDYVTGTKAGLPQGNAARTLEARGLTNNVGSNGVLFNYGTASPTRKKTTPTSPWTARPMGSASPKSAG